MSYSLEVLKKERSRLQALRARYDAKEKESPALELIEVRKELKPLLDKITKPETTIDDHKRIQSKLKKLQEREEQAHKRIKEQCSGKHFKKILEVDEKLGDLERVIFRLEIRG